MIFRFDPKKPGFPTLVFFYNTPNITSKFSLHR